MRENSSSYAMDEMDTQESVTGVQSRLICHVPDFVWSAEDQVIDTPKAIMTNGVLLFADVSGFTALTERYSNHREGVSGLTHALNGYIRQGLQKRTSILIGWPLANKKGTFFRPSKRNMPKNSRKWWRYPQIRW